MSLEFNRIVPQVYKMGAMLENLDFDVTDALAVARQRFEESAGDMSAVWERIRWVRESDVSGYRGAAPLDIANSEPINALYPPPPVPEQAVIIAADGSQIYPEEQAPVHYYVLNIGLFVYYHGIDRIPEQFTHPDLKFHKDYVHDRYGRIVANRTIDDRRTVEEMRKLAELSWAHRTTADHVIALYDNRLMFLPGGDDVRESNANMSAYMGAMVHLHDAGATLAGYIDNPFRSKRVMQLLYLLSLEDKEDIRQKQHEIARCGDLEGLRDQFFFMHLLKPGYRTAIMVQSSPQNLDFRRKGENYEIAFFYLNVGNAYRDHVVRVDVPVWVARDRARVDALHALLLDQCEMQGRNPYPYAITRADELAYVGNKDRSKLKELIDVQVRRVKEDLIGRTLTAKSRGKELARSDKRYHNLRGQEIIDDN